MMGRLEEALLSALLIADGEATTNEIFETLKGKHARLSSAGIFITLDRLSKKGLVSVRKGDPLPERGGKARLYYKITTGGRAALGEVRQASASISSLMKPSQSS